MTESLRKQSFFVTGTDTGIGKTYVSRLLADTMAESTKVTYMKPVQTGCTIDTSGMIRAPDFDHVMQGKAIMTGSYEQHVPYRFEPACSPHLAAELAGIPISFTKVKECFESVQKKGIVLLIEGAGGILAPLSRTTYILDLILFLKIPVLLVTSPRLGTLNHTILTIEYLRMRDILLAGLIMNYHDGSSEGYIYNDNRRMLKEHVFPVPFLEVHHGANSGDESVRGFCKDIIRNGIRC